LVVRNEVNGAICVSVKKIKWLREVCENQKMQMKIF